MWNPNVKLSNWFKIHPDLSQLYPLTCLCGKQLPDVIPYVTKNYIGIKSGACSCGIGVKSISIPRNEKTKKDIISTMKKLEQKWRN